MALLMASGLFGLAFWGISLDLRPSVPESRQAAKILLLDTISPEMALWIDQHSPFPSRWDPQYDEEHAARVGAELTDLYKQISIPPSSWRDMPEQASQQVAVPKLIIEGEVDLGPLPEVEKHTPKPVVLELTVTLAGYGAMDKRIPEVLVPFTMKIPKQAYGTTQRFTLSLRPDGSVLNCTPVEWENSEFSRELENWVRVQPFLPVKKEGVELGEISVNVEVKAHARN
jgi:hypothetical protein